MIRGQKMSDKTNTMKLKYVKQLCLYLIIMLNALTPIIVTISNPTCCSVSHAVAKWRADLRQQTNRG
jgi:hypothetical protein